MADTLKRGAELLGDDWGYVDITNALYAISKLGRPENYLEIGVRRGRSMCMVVAATPTVNVVGFDVWQDNYAGNENPGETLVKAELAKFGHSGRATFIGGDSRVTVRDYLSKHPDLTFDLMTVDGDHSAEGAIFDLESVVDRLRVGGVLLFDDLDNPHCLDLNAVWDRFTAKYSNLRCHKIFNPLGFGVAIAVKTSTLVGTVSGRSKWFGR